MRGLELLLEVVTLVTLITCVWVVARVVVKRRAERKKMRELASRLERSTKALSDAEEASSSSREKEKEKY